MRNNDLKLSFSPSQTGSTQTQRAPTPHSETKTGEEGLQGGGGGGDSSQTDGSKAIWRRGGGVPHRVWDYRYGVHATQGNLAHSREWGGESHVHVGGWWDRRRLQEAPVLMLLEGFTLNRNTSGLTRQQSAGFFFVFCDKAQLGGTTDNGQEREKDGGAGTWGVSGVREGRAVLLNSMHPTRSS